MFEIKRYDMSDDLRAFLRSWLEWVEAGAPPRKPYARHTGLCGAASKYSYDVYDELYALFLPEPYPFGADEYEDAAVNNTQHLDPNRLAFVRANMEPDQ